jgi:hypothetical protein
VGGESVERRGVKRLEVVVGEGVASVLIQWLVFSLGWGRWRKGDRVLRGLWSRQEELNGVMTGMSLL